MNLHAIASGSSGNCYCIDNGGHFIFIDAGASLSSVKKCIGSKKPSCADLFITHEHTDHISGIMPLISAYSPMVYASEKTAAVLASKGVDDERLYVLDADTVYDFDSFTVKPFNINHDAEEPFGYRFDFGGNIFSIATDFGAATDYVLKSLEGSDTVIIESNYEDDILKKNKKYPAYLKRRILSKNGHLSNKDAFFMLGEMKKSGLKRCFLAHVSENNNDYGLLQKYADACAECHHVEAAVLRQKRSAVFDI